MQQNRALYEHISFEEVKEFLKTCSAAVYKELECRNCSGYCHPPFRKCYTGHFICQTCYCENEACELCQSENFTERLHFLEKVHALLEFPCENLGHGCGFQGRGEVIMLHQKECQYAIIPCPNAECGWQSKPSDLFPHYGHFHPFNLIENEEELNRICEKTVTNDDVLLTNIIQQFNRVFVVVLIISHDEETIRFIATNLELFKDVENFELFVDFTLKDGSKWTLQGAFRFSDNVAERTTFETIQSEKIGKIKKSDNPNAHYDYIIRIKTKMATQQFYDSDESDEYEP